jgi:hypothetical protein
MSSEHAIEQVPLAEIQEGDTIQDPKSGNWSTVTRTADGTTSVTHRYSDGERTVIEEYRVYYGTEVRRSIPGSLRASSIARSESNHPCA